MKKRVPALGSAEDLVSQLGVAENDPRAMRIAKISEMKRLGTASKEEKEEWSQLLVRGVNHCHLHPEGWREIVRGAWCGKTRLR
jgi:hypothetical protein